MDIIRLLLLEQESDESSPELAKYNDKLVVYNAALMLDAKLIDGVPTTDENGEIIEVKISRMTWAGHDFLDSTRDPTFKLALVAKHTKANGC